jgi:uncharacterized membrane protein YkvA (DUF1232 family)
MKHAYAHPLGGAGRLIEPGNARRLWLAWKLLRDPRVSGFKYLLPALLALYVASPIDGIPDFLVGLGQADDIGVVVLGVLILIRVLPKLAPKDVVAEYSHGREPVATAQPGAHDIVDARFTVRQ